MIDQSQHNPLKRFQIIPSVHFGSSQQCRGRHMTQKFQATLSVSAASIDYCTSSEKTSADGFPNPNHSENKLCLNVWNMQAYSVSGLKFRQIDVLECHS